MNIQIFKRLPATLVAKLNQKLRFALVEKRQNDVQVTQKASRVPSPLQLLKKADHLNDTLA